MGEKIIRSDTYETSRGRITAEIVDYGGGQSDQSSGSNPTELSFHAISDVDGLLEIDAERIACVDVETTGLSPTRDEVIQIAICDGYGNMLLSSYVRPERRKSWPKAEEVNHISPAMVADAPTLIDLSERIEDILGKASLVIGFNIEKFDLEFLKVGRVNMPSWMRTYDLIYDCSVMFGKWSDYHGDYSFVSLEKMASVYGIEYNAHDASEDAMVTAKVFRRFLNDTRLRSKVSKTEESEARAREIIAERRAKEEREREETNRRLETEKLERERGARNLRRGCLISVVIAITLLFSMCSAMCHGSSSRRHRSIYMMPPIVEVTP